MAFISNYLASQIINHVFRSSTFTKPTVLAIALCTSATSDSDTGNLAGKEVVGGGYSRQTLNPSDTNWEINNNRQAQNLIEVNFEEATTDWGIITHIAIIDNSTIGTGNLLFHGPIQHEKEIFSGDRAVLRIDAITFNITS